MNSCDKAFKFDSFNSISNPTTEQEEVGLMQPPPEDEVKSFKVPLMAWTHAPNKPTES